MTMFFKITPFTSDSFLWETRHKYVQTTTIFHSEANKLPLLIRTVHQHVIYWGKHGKALVAFSDLVKKNHIDEL